MPAVVPFLVYAFTNSALAAFAASLVVGAAQARKAKRKARDAYNNSLTDRYVMAALVDGARSRVYGRARNVDGVLFKGTWGPDNRYYTLVVAFAGHECDAVEQIYFNDVPVTLDGSGYVQTAPWARTDRLSYTEGIILTGSPITLARTPVTGTVSCTWPVGTEGEILVFDFSLSGADITVSGPPGQSVLVNYQADVTTSYARVRTYMGTAAQDISGLLTPNFPDVTSADKFAGITLGVVDLEYSQDAYPSGPPVVTALLRGAKILDHRTSTTAWNQNPSCIIRDWSLYPYGGNLASTSFDDTAGDAAANACDVDATYTTGASSVVLDTYQCGIVCKLDASPQDWLDEMVESMAGRWGWAGGKLRVVAGSYRSPVATITEDWVSDASDINVTKDVPVSDLVNSYRVSIVNRDNNYVVEPLPRLAPSAYTTADGQELPREIAMAGVTKREQALHIAGVLLRDARQSLVCELPCNYRAFALELFDTVSVTLPHFGWSAKVFELVGWRYSLDKAVALELKETAASIYTVDAAFTGLENDDNTSLPNPSEVAEVTGLAATSTVAGVVDGQSLVRTLVQWDASTDIAVLQSGWIEIQYLQLGLVDAPAQWQNNTPVAVSWESGSLTVGWNSLQTADAGSGWNTLRVRGDQTSHMLTGLRADGIYLFRARAENTIGARSKWSKQILVQIGSAPLPATIERFSAFDAAGVGYSNFA